MNFEDIKATIPWQLKIAAKIVLSRLPLPYTFWQRIQLFRLGQMDDPKVAIETLEWILGQAPGGIAGKSVLELGPGDALSTAIIAKVLGARETILIDAGDFARKDRALYRTLIGTLKARGHDVSAFDGVSAIPDLLQRANARYLTGGLASVMSLEAGSIDFVFSKAVLEHVRRHEFQAMCQALWRVTKPDGLTHHTIDLRDHLGNGLNNLRFSKDIWESPLFARSGFYTNRIHYAEMLRLFDEAGFSIELTRVQKFGRIPIKRQSLAPAFRNLPDDELIIADFDVLLRKKT